MTEDNIAWSDRYQRLQATVRNFVDGRWRSEAGGEAIEKRSPRDGRLLTTFGSGRESDVEDAISAAKRAFDDGRWSAMPVDRRKEILAQLAALVEKHHDEFALLESVDVGKPISDALNFDIPAAAATIRQCAEGADKWYGNVYGADRTSLSYELRRPFGVVAAIVGWNFPLLLAALKAGSALATGNSLVLKPSELTSLSSARLAELALQAGVPPGVFNVIHGGGKLGAGLARHKDVDFITFTGSTRTGRSLMVATGETSLKPLLLECGGKAPNIVFEDCPDLDAVAKHVVARAFWNQGQVCTASSRLLIQKSIKATFLPILIEKIAALRIGDPLDSETDFGAVVSGAHRQKVVDFISLGRAEGANLVFQSNAAFPFEEGYYVAPTVFDGVTSKQRLAQDEIFGPVLSVLTFKDEDEAISIANGTIYGLSAILWTTDIGRAHRLTQAIKAGWIIVNATANPANGADSVIPTGGHKQSGFGVEGGIDGLRGYTNQTTVQINV